MTTTRTLLLGVLVILIITGVMFYSNRKDSTQPEIIAQTSQEAVTSPLETETKLCYLHESQNDSLDAEYIELSLNLSTKKAHGIYNRITQNDNSRRGTLTGSYENTPTSPTQPTEGFIFKGKHQFVVNNYQEGREIYITFDALGSQIGQGELVGNGTSILSYKDPSKVTYGQTIQRVDCSNVQSTYSELPQFNGES